MELQHWKHKFWPGFFVVAAMILFSGCRTRKPIPESAAGSGEQNETGDTGAGSISQFRTKLNQSPESRDALLGLARAYARAERYQDALRTYNQLLKKHPEDLEGRLGRGRLLGWMEKYERAERDLKWATNNHGNAPDPWNALGNLYLWWGKPEKAEKAFDQLIQQRPDDPEAYIARGNARDQQGKYELADRDYRTAEKKSDSPREVKRLRRNRQWNPDRYPWEARLTGSQTSFHDRFEDWRVQTLRIGRSFPEGAGALEVARRDRFGDVDTTVAGDVYRTLWKNAYGNLRVQWGPDPDTMPRTDVLLELFQGIGNGWEISPGYRNMNFPSDNVDIYSVALGKYVGNWYLRLKSQVVKETKDDGISATLTARYNLNRSDVLEFIVGAGEETVPLAEGRVFEDQQTETYGFRMQKFITPRWGLEGALEYRDEDTVPIRRTASIGIIHRW